MSAALIRREGEQAMSAALIRREGEQAMSAALIRRCLTLLADSAGQCAQVQATARAHVLEEARKAGLS